MHSQDSYQSSVKLKSRRLEHDSFIFGTIQKQVFRNNQGHIQVKADFQTIPYKNGIVWISADAIFCVGFDELIQKKY